jgi:hypothetical protein
MNRKILHCCGIKQYTQTEVTANRPDMRIKKEKENMHTGRCGNTCRQKWCAKGSRQDDQIQECMSKDTTNVEHEMCDYTANNWSHRNSKKLLQETLEAIIRKHSTGSLRRTSILGNSTHNTESTAV